MKPKSLSNFTLIKKESSRLEMSKLSKYAQSGSINKEILEEKKSFSEPGVEAILEEKSPNQTEEKNLPPKRSFLTFENIAEENSQINDESNRSAMGMVQDKKKINDFTVEPVNFRERNIE